LGIIPRDGGVAPPRSRNNGKSETFRLRLLLEQAQERAVQLAIQVREADHRIKNSLQIASSVMQAEARRSDNEELRDSLKSAASRILAIGMVHDALQARGVEGLVDIGDLMELMCSAMLELSDGKAEIHFYIGVTSLKVPVTFARSLMLVVNEIIVNALQHAFPLDKAGTISVSIERTADHVRVVVEDDGVGLAIMDTAHVGFGTELIQMMTRQIHGTLESDCASGTRCTLTAPLPANLDAIPVDADASAFHQPPIWRSET
jgi:two-component system, sensor histidine kinase PdtaS